MNSPGHVENVAKMARRAFQRRELLAAEMAEIDRELATLRTAHARHSGLLMTPTVEAFRRSVTNKASG